VLCLTRVIFDGGCRIKHLAGGTFFFVPPYAANPTFQWAAKEIHMPIRLVVANSEDSYLATDAGILVDAFEGVLNELRLADRNDPAVLFVANRIIAFAKTGVLDPLKLRDLTVKAVRRDRPPPLTPAPLTGSGARGC
jgi:hypothetical protein